MEARDFSRVRLHPGRSVSAHLETAAGQRGGEDLSASEDGVGRQDPLLRQREGPESLVPLRTRILSRRFLKTVPSSARIHLSAILTLFFAYYTGEGRI